MRKLFFLAILVVAILAASGCRHPKLNPTDKDGIEAEWGASPEEIRALGESAGHLSAATVVKNLAAKIKNGEPLSTDELVLVEVLYGRGHRSIVAQVLRAGGGTGATAGSATAAAPRQGDKLPGVFYYSGEYYLSPEDSLRTVPLNLWEAAEASRDPAFRQRIVWDINQALGK